MVTSCKFHPKLHAAFCLFMHRPITTDCIAAMMHVNIIAKYLNGKILSSLTCLKEKKKKIDVAKLKE